MNTLEIVERSPGIYRGIAGLGCNIKAVCDAAIKVARKKNVKVVFAFNGTEIVADARDSPDSLTVRYNADFAIRAQEWRESEDGKLCAVEQQRLIEAQQTINRMIADLDNVVGIEFALISWIGRFAELNDHVDLYVNRAALVAKLEAVGYTDNAEVGNSPEEIRSNKAKLARYIIGQSINCLRQGMPVHRECSRFAADYAALHQKQYSPAILPA